MAYWRICLVTRRLSRAQRKAGRYLPIVPCGSSPVVRLYLAKNEAPEEEAELESFINSGCKTLAMLKYLLYVLGRLWHKPEEGDRQWTTYMKEVEISVFYYASQHHWKFLIGAHADHLSCSFIWSLKFKVHESLFMSSTNSVLAEPFFYILDFGVCTK